MTNLNNQITASTIVRTWGVKPSHGGFGEFDTYCEPSEWAEFGDHFGDVDYIHADEFASEGIEDIRGRIRGERGELYAWLDRGEWEYALVEVQRDDES